MKTMVANFGLTIRSEKGSSELSTHLEELRERGYTIIPGLLDEARVASYRGKLEAVYARQEAEFGREALQSIAELDMCRLPCAYDRDFLSLASHPTILAVMSEILGSFFILHLQNGIINRPDRPHHQHSWHRDLPYQDFAITRPLAISALVALDAFSPETGGTYLLPFSHRMPAAPTDAYIANNRVVAEAPAGSVILFDSMLIHRAGSNSSQNVRCAVNHVYTAPILKQQYDLPRALGPATDFDDAMQRLLGYTSQVARDDRQWRVARLDRIRSAPPQSSVSDAV